MKNIETGKSTFINFDAQKGTGTVRGEGARKAEKLFVEVQENEKAEDINLNEEEKVEEKQTKHKRMGRKGGKRGWPHIIQSFFEGIGKLLGLLVALIMGSVPNQGVPEEEVSSQALEEEGGEGTSAALGEEGGEVPPEELPDEVPPEELPDDSKITGEEAPEELPGEEAPEELPGEEVADDALDAEIVGEITKSPEEVGGAVEEAPVYTETLAEYEEEQFATQAKNKEIQEDLAETEELIKKMREQ